MRFLAPIFVTAALCAGLLGCDDTTSGAPALSTVLSGEVHLDGPSARAQLQLYVVFDRDGQERLLSETQSAEDGTFALETSGSPGPFKVVVQPPGRADILTSYIGELGGLDAIAQAHVVITPMSFMTAALADFYVAQAHDQAMIDGMSLDVRGAFAEALAAASAPITTHFFGAGEARPARLSVEAPELLDEPATLTGLALDGLAELARLKAQAAGVGLEGILSTALLTEALVNDVRHDGLFDGQGPDGPVLVLNQRLDSHTLRRDYALALLRFAQSERNLSRFERADVRRYANDCAGSQAVIFPPDIDSQLEADPPLVVITPKDGSVVSGTVFTEITASDAHKIDRVEQSSAPADFDWRIVAGPPDELREDEGLWYRFDYRFADTTALPDGTYTVTAIGVDELDNATREEVRWIVDNTAPTVTIEAPTDAAILSGEEREVVARAIDTNGLAHFALTTPDGVIHLADIPEPGEDVVSPTEAEIRVTYNSQREVDGIYAITATAEDVVRNQANDAIEVQVDNAAPEITFRSPRDGATVDGLVQIIVEAEDAAPIRSFVVTTPDDVEHAFERNPDGAWRAELEWDSTTVRDGHGYPITATVTDSQGNRAAITNLVEVNNVDEGIATGVAHFDSPVAGLAVEAWTIGAEPERVDLCALSREGLCVTDEDGDFEIEIADNYQGPLLLKAIADQNAFAEYIDAATGNIAGINDFDLRTLIVDYQPGGRYEGLVFSAASTLTSDWLLATLGDGDVAAQARAAITTWGQHLCPVGANEAPCDPTTTRPQRYDGTDEEFVAQSAGALLGLVQAGLARRAADLRLRHDEPAFWAVGLLKRFRRDMEDGVLDGKRDEELIQIDSHPRDHRYLGACSLRSGLAAGMGSFLNKIRLLDLDVEARNATQLDKESMAVYLRGLSTRVDRAVWGPIFQGGQLVWDYCEYDSGAPDIIVAQPANNELYGPNGGADTADWSLLVRASAQDDSGIGEMWIESGNPLLEPVFDAFNTSPESFIVRVDYDDLPEGEMPLVINATDLAGNTRETTLRPIIDLSPPDVMIFTTALERFDPNTGEIVYRLDEPVESSADSPVFTDNEAIVLGIASDEPITISGTDASNVQSAFRGFRYFVTFPLNPGIDRLALTIADSQGNATREDIWVLRDDEGPSIELVDSGHYQPEDTLDWVGVDCVGEENCSRVRFNFDQPSQIDSADLQHGVRGVPHAFVKLYENWNGELTGRANQPTLNFRWADELGEDVSVDYRVLTAQAGIEGTCCNDVRFAPLGGWRPLDAGNGEVRLPVRPETIDPQIGLDRNQVYRVEARVTNRAGISATTSAVFFVRLIAPPVIAWLDAERWRESGSGIGSVDFSNPLELTEICDGESALQRRLSNLHVYNPWPYPVRVSARGVATVEQFNRKAWLLDGRNVGRPPCLADIGTYRTAGNNERCYDTPEQIPDLIQSRQRIHNERVDLAPVVTADDVALPRAGDAYILASEQDALVSLQLPACDIPFLPPDLSEPRPRRPRLVVPHPDDRRILEVDRSRPNLPGLFDRYRPFERVSRLRFGVANMSLRLSPPIDDAPFVVWHERWTDSYEIDNPALSLPEGLEGDD